jgi:hypothetical protein
VKWRDVRDEDKMLQSYLFNHDSNKASNEISHVFDILFTSFLPVAMWRCCEWMMKKK